MKLSDLIAADYPAAAYQQTPIWNKDLEQLTPIILLMGTQTLENHIGRPDTETAFHSLMEELDRAFLFGKMQQATILKPRLNRHRVTTFQLVELLKQLDVIEARALLYCAIERIPMNQVLTLSRSEATMTYKTKLGFVLIKKSVPHFKCPLLFWRLKDEQPAALPQVDKKVETLTHQDFQPYVDQVGQLLDELTEDQHTLLESWL
jgi:hypothetical protein